MSMSEPTTKPTRTSLITGGAGFIGSHLADRLLARGEEVWALDDLSTGSMDNIAHLLDHPRFHFARGSVRDAALMDQLGHGCSTVYHLAAVVGVQNVLDDPLRVVEENIFGTRSVLEATSKAGARIFLASTSEIYGKNVEVPFKEDADRILGPSHISRWSYAMSKTVDEVLTIGYCDQHGMQIIIGRFFNTIGQRQTGEYGMVVPRFIEQALTGEPLTVFGDGGQTRTFCDVRDTLAAVIGLMDDPEAAGRAYNIGSEEEITIAQLARMVLAQLAPERADDPDAIRFVPFEDAYEGKGGAFDVFPRRVPDTMRVQRQLGWKRRYTLADTIEWIAEDVRARLGGQVPAGRR